MIYFNGMAFFFVVVIVSVHSYNIIPPNRLEFEVVYIFHEESLEFVFFLKRN